MSSHKHQWLNELPDAFKAYREDRTVYEVECIVPDLAGMSRGKAMPIQKFSPGHETYLPISIFYQTITGEDVELDIEDQWAESDIVLKPDMSTAKAVPWAKEATLQVIHDLFYRNGKPVEMAPRNVLKHIMGLYRQQGWKPVVAPELEFYLTNPNLDANEPIQPPIGRTGRQGAGRQSYSMSAVDEYGPVIDTIYDYAEDAGLNIDTVIQEDGAGQVEINLTHGDPVDLADQVFFFKRIIKEAALNHGMFATFMAKPMKEQPGSAMHVHQSVVDIKTGKNIFSDEQGEATDIFMHFIGGSQKYMPLVMPLIAPYVNSYRRFESDTNSSAPTNVEWGYDNRATGLRVPMLSSADQGAQDRRLENRVIGVDCNPYLAIAASLACGYLGMLEKVGPSDPITGELEESDYTIPMTLDHALNLFQNTPAIREVLGSSFSMVYEEVKLAEVRQFHREISPWEREHLLLNV